MAELRVDWMRFTHSVEEMCDDYCHWPVVCADQDDLRRHCDECPINNLNNEQYWEGINACD